MSSASATMQFEVRAEGVAHHHALPPVLLGFLAPMLLFLLIDPRAITNASVIVHFYMIAIFVIASAAYLISVFETGEITSVTFDKGARRVSVERTGVLAKSLMELDFADVATVRVETRYDDDGYQTAIPVIVLTTRETIPLPAGTTEADVANMRAVLRRD